MNNKNYNDDLIDVSDDKSVDIKLDIDTSHKSSIEHNHTTPKESYNADNVNIDPSKLTQSNLANNDFSKNMRNNPAGYKDHFSNSLDDLDTSHNDSKSIYSNNGRDIKKNNGFNNKKNNSNNYDNDFGENIPYDNRSLGEKAKDAKDGIKNTVDNIKNAPQNIKDKIDDTKDKINNVKDKAKKAKENIKQAPENMRKKAAKAKEMWNNRPRSFSDVKDKLKGGIKNAPKKVAQGAKKAGTKALEKGKEEAKEKLESSNIGQAVKKTQEAVKKTKHAIEVTKKAFAAIQNFFVITFPWLEIILAVGIAIFGIILLATHLLPGIFGPAKKEESYKNYAEVDQKTLEKLKKEFAGFDANDAALGMATVVYPYFSQLFDGNVTNYLSTSDNEIDEDEADIIIDPEGAGLDNEDIVKEEGDQEADDMYLLPFRDSKVRNRLEKVLKHIKGGEEDWQNYLKDTYFDGDKGSKKYFDEKVMTGYNGYKKLFKALIDDSDEDELEDAIIKNLHDIKDMFLPYIIESAVQCTSSLTSIGYSDVGGIIQGEPYVILKDTKKTVDLSGEPTLYGTDVDPLTLKRFVLGSIYVEMETSIDYEQSAKAFIIAAKSFVLGITKNGQGIEGDIAKGRKYEVKDGKTYFYIRPSTADEDYCDIYEGCKTGRFAKSQIIYDNYAAKSNVKDPVSPEKIALLEKWYDDVADVFLYDGNIANNFGGMHLSKWGVGICKKGYCLDQTRLVELAKQGYSYEAILADSYDFSNRFALYSYDTQQLSVAEVNCSGASSGGCAIAAEEFKYYSQRQFNDQSVGFCGRNAKSGEEKPTISTSGCGVTSMAMVISNLTDENMDPVDTMNEAASASNPGPFCGEGIVGTDVGYFKYSSDKHGITYSSVVATAEDAEQQVRNTLSAGGLVIANVGKGWQRKDQGPVEVGHYLVIRGISGDGTLLLADPMLKEAALDPNDSISFADIVVFMKNADGTPKSFFLFTSSKSAEIKETYCTAPVTGESGEVTGYLGNPLDPSRTDVDYYSRSIGNSACYPRYCPKGRGSVHGGVDLPHSSIYSLGLSDPVAVYAMDGGVVSEVTNYSGNCYNGSTKCTCSGSSYGISVTIKHGDTGYSTHYAHLSQRLVDVNDTIAKGQQIGVMGNTGCSSGAHLHIELRSPLYSINGRDKAKGSENKGLMNPTKYINQNVTYIGQGK